MVDLGFPHSEEWDPVRRLDVHPIHQDSSRVAPVEALLLERRSDRAEHFPASREQRLAWGLLHVLVHGKALILPHLGDALVMYLVEGLSQCQGSGFVRNGTEEAPHYLDLGLCGCSATPGGTLDANFESAYRDGFPTQWTALPERLPWLDHTFDLPQCDLRVAV